MSSTCKRMLFTILFAILSAMIVHPAPIDNRVIIRVGEPVPSGLLWASIGLAVFTGLFQGMVTTMATIAEDASMWTFRFRIARFEHLWWTFVSVLLTLSLILITLSFLAGNRTDAVSILVLCTATGIAIVRYAVPSWRSRRFINNRWLSWTGQSRSTIAAAKARFCGESDHWRTIYKAVVADGEKLPLTSSDEWGLSIPFRPTSLIAPDATTVLEKVNTTKNLAVPHEKRYGIYNDGLDGATTVSLLWGESQGFRRRVSRAINSMPLNLLKSQPVTIDNYAGAGLCLAMGALGRNKGLKPGSLVYKSSFTIHASLEQTSTWAPRPSKVLRGYYRDTMSKQYSTISQDFVDAAVELALILADCSHEAIRDWFLNGLEHQDWSLNKLLEEKRATPEELNALYRASYVSMVVSLNYINYPGIDRGMVKLPRPDLHAMAWLMMAESEPKPSWWDHDSIQGRLREEQDGLYGGEWKKPMAALCGLTDCPDVGRWIAVNVTGRSESVAERQEELTSSGSSS